MGPPQLLVEVFMSHEIILEGWVFGVGVLGALEAIGASELFKATLGLGLVP